MVQTIEIVKTVPITNVITDLENLLSEICNNVSLQLSNNDYPALEISGTPPKSLVDAATLNGKLPGYYDITSHSINDLADVDTSSKLDGYILIWNNTTLKWEAKELILSLEDMSNIRITNPSNKEILIYEYNTGNWINSTLGYAGIAAIDHDHNTVYLRLIGGTLSGYLTAPEYRINDTNTKLIRGTSNAVRIQTNSGYIDVGPQNTSLSHFMTDRPEFYFNKPVNVETRLKIYNTNTYLTGTEGRINNSIIWHQGNDGVGSGLDADLLDGQQGSFYQNASNLNAGTVPTARLAGTYSISITGNADTVDGNHASAFATSGHNHDSVYLKLSGGTLSGSLIASYNLTITGTAKAAGYFYAGATAPSSTTRLNYDGYLYATRVYNAIYNDYAECFCSDGLIYNEVVNRIVEIDSDGKLSLAKENSDGVIGIVSDSYGFLLNSSEEEIENGSKIPVGLAGTLYVDSEEAVDDRNIYRFICSGKDGKARVIPKGKAYKYEGCIVGKIIGVNKEKNQYKIIISLR